MSENGHQLDAQAGGKRGRQSDEDAPPAAEPRTQLEAIPEGLASGAPFFVLPSAPPPPRPP